MCHGQAKGVRIENLGFQIYVPPLDLSRPRAVATPGPVLSRAAVVVLVVLVVVSRAVVVLGVVSRAA